MPARIRIDRRFTLLLHGDEWNNSYKCEFQLTSYGSDNSLLEQIHNQLITQWGGAFNVHVRPHDIGSFTVDESDVTPIQFVDSTNEFERDSNVLISFYKVHPSSPLAQRLKASRYHNPFEAEVDVGDIDFQNESGQPIFKAFKTVTLPLDRVRTRPDGFRNQNYHVHVCLVG